MLFRSVLHTWQEMRSERLNVLLEALKEALVQTPSEQVLEQLCRQLGVINKALGLSPNEFVRSYEAVRTFVLGVQPEVAVQLDEVKAFLESLQGEVRPRIMISIFAFTHGGGEIMPIRLANALYDLGYPVLVHNYEYAPDEPSIRAMLYPEIEVVVTQEVKAFVALLKVYQVEVIHTHHQALQCLVAAAFKLEETLKESVYHVDRKSVV